MVHERELCVSIRICVKPAFVLTACQCPWHCAVALDHSSVPHFRHVVFPRLYAWIIFVRNPFFLAFLPVSILSYS